MNILILEDDIERIKIFREKLIGHKATDTDCSKAAIELLKTNTYDVLFLDHDLGGKAFVESGENTGFEVAKFLSLNPNYKPFQIILHFLNPVGRKNMKAVLPDAVDFPGAWACIGIKDGKLELIDKIIRF